MAFVVDHEARAGGDAAALGFRFAEGREALFFARRHLRFDEGDPVAVGLVDLVDDVAAVATDLETTGAVKEVVAGSAGSLSDLTHPADIAIRPKTATMAPPSRAEKNETREDLFEFGMRAGSRAPLIHF